MMKNGEWEEKDTYKFYIEILSDLLDSFIYITFFVFIFMNYGIPLHLIREIYTTILSIYQRILDLYNYRKLVSNFDSRFENATPDELKGILLFYFKR
jgi:E3 ubiquitin-protein ligase synoviolin